MWFRKKAAPIHLDGINVTLDSSVDEGTIKVNGKEVLRLTRGINVKDTFTVTDKGLAAIEEAKRENAWS